MNGLHDAALHVEHPRSRGATVTNGEGSGSESTQREDGVVMSDQQHFGRSPARPPDVGTVRRLDDRRLGTQTITHDGRKSGGARTEGVEVARRRFDLDQPAKILDHVVEDGHGEIGHASILTDVDP